MGLAKTEILTDQQNQITLYAKVFGHPARVAILQHLFKINKRAPADVGLIFIAYNLKSILNLIGKKAWDIIIKAIHS